MGYDASRIANFGRDTARAYGAFLRAEKKLCDEINAAIEAGIKPIKITHDVLGRCSTREAQIDLMSALLALAEMEKIPKSVAEPFADRYTPETRMRRVMLDSDKRDELTERIERAQISAIHRALDQAWALGHADGNIQDHQQQVESMEASTYRSKMTSSPTDQLTDRADSSGSSTRIRLRSP
jgi:hypothetical protein